VMDENGGGIVRNCAGTSRSRAVTDDMRPSHASRRIETAYGKLRTCHATQKTTFSSPRDRP
ncbi:hypothetical protein, partial [Bifidobacterium jacchi]|uniref:hypothetical protein n=1 Tax=Bifidobacterium jacchi TaxID=2490545 RepID=UPI0019D57379